MINWRPRLSKGDLAKALSTKEKPLFKRQITLGRGKAKRVAVISVAPEGVSSLMAFHGHHSEHLCGKDSPALVVQRAEEGESTQQLFDRLADLAAPSAATQQEARSQRQKTRSKSRYKGIYLFANRLL